jgi:phosphatidylethanolamine-binding protein (PEBP) family uncharacterized protein
MHYLTLPLSLLAIISITSFTDPKNTLVITSAFQNNSPIPVKYTCKGPEFSPPISIANVPENTKSFAIVVFDPDGSKVPDAPVAIAPKAKPGKATKKKIAKKPTASVVPCDPNAKCFINWIMWNLDPTSNILPENFKSDNEGLNTLLPHKSVCAGHETEHQ